MTEAQEAAQSSLQDALRNLAFQVMFGETAGVLQMYEDAAVKLGATPSQIHRARNP
jgi:hypothetical protein